MEQVRFEPGVKSQALQELSYKLTDAASMFSNFLSVLILLVIEIVFVIVTI